MGIYAVTLFTKLGNSVDVILKENFRSVVAGLSEMSNFLTSVATSYQDMDQSIASKISR